MKTLNIYIFIIIFFYSYLAFGSITTLNGSEDPPFQIGVLGGYLPATTNETVAGFTITNSNWTVMSWYIDNTRCANTNSQGGTQGADLTSSYLYVVFKNIKINKTSHIITCLAKRLGNTYWASYTVPGFTLVMPTPTFASGSTMNVPCYSTTAQINLNDYTNVTGHSEGLEITDEFEWTLPNGWQTTSAQTGTFVSGKTINIVLPFSSASENITVRAKAYDQYSASATLHITRNFENFSIEGPTTATCYSTKRFTAPATPSGITYTWQLPSGWTGVSNENYIDAAVTGSSGTIICTMNGCGQSKVSTKDITVNIVETGTIISGPASVCSSGTEFYINSLPEGATIAWNPGSGITRVSEQGSNPCTFSSSGTGIGLIEASINTNCGNTTLPVKTVWKGVPVINSISGPQYLPYGGNWVYSANVSGAEGATYQWSISPSLPLTSYGDNAEISFPSSNGDYAISLTVTSLCGLSSTYYYYLATGEYEPFIIFPNPSSGETTLTLSPETNDNALNTDTAWDMEIYSESQTLKTKQTKLSGKSVKIQTTGWKEGVYLVRVKYNNKFLIGKLVVKQF